MDLGRYAERVRRAARRRPMEGIEITVRDLEGNGDIVRRIETIALADQFTQMFREEHRQVRDTLLDLVQVLRSRDRERVQALLGQAAALTGPHLRYEEESLYLGLVQIFGEEYVEKLLGDHDMAIGTAKKLAETAGGALSDEDMQRAVRYVRSILPHVSDCDGLSIMVERLPERDVQAVFAARDRAREANLNLLEGADQVRGRPAVLPA